ncbi:MAG: hypothetical protein ACYC44_05145 [Patescibacteria group bacterium]
MKTKTFLFIALALALSGAGCSWISEKAPGISSMIPAGPKPANFENASPAEASKRINFVPGSQVEIRQTYLGADAKKADALAGDNKEGVRIITLERFAPMVYAKLSWKLSSQGATSTEMRTVRGSVENINLKSSHEFYPPAYWPSDTTDAKDTSAIWLSQDAFEELTKTKHATLFYGLTDGLLFGDLRTAKEFFDAITSLSNQVIEANKTTDTDWAKADEEYSDWTLKVNGQDIKVQVIKAHNWFGEIVVLNNPQNPLVIKMTFNPALQDKSLLKSSDFLTTLLGYEVTQLDNVQ